ncbi:amino acid permease/ SLC12A domain-containing protein [Aspergillus bertholletiae]|uniref:Amino acid permease/ SLC12A domain-containing protein n=1 Tax=Aspergillus bertholletiae TaxID=1226010 RepID=A0A5N7AVL4_9EURO|nr:amino acid permease/ SLC12A domain-containing protein [Aspergillus bertholletiae]
MKKNILQPDFALKCGSDVQRGTISGDVANANGLHRTLGNRQIQLIAIGGSIGTAIFLTIGSALTRSGPGSLFLAFLLHNIMLGLINNCMAEMAVYMPVSGGFIRMASTWVDEAWGFMAGWNFFIYEALNIPFEITAIHTILSFWRDDIPAAAVCAACIVLYGSLNILVVKIYGESEFWLSSGKVLLIFILFSFTFVTMVGGNPHGDAYGFRHWQDPGAFAEYLHTGDLGRFEGFLSALWYAAFTCVGPEYISMIAGEAKHPRIYLKSAFKTAYWRFGVFFIGSALCTGIVVAYNDPALIAVANGDSDRSGAASSPYVVAMENLGIGVLPHIVNALLITTIFSAGNTYVYAASRSLYALSCEGKAPKFLRKCTKKGVPIYSFAVVMAFPFLSLLQLSHSSATVLSWLINILSGAAVINFIVMSATYIFFYRACKHQRVDRSTLPYKGWFQPWAGYISLIWMTVIAVCNGYSSFMPWSLTEFFTHYTMILLAILTFFGWKIAKGTTLLPSEVADLRWESAEIIAYEEAANDPPVGFWTETFQFLGQGTRPRVEAV